MGGLVSSLFDLFSGNPYEAQTNQINQIAGYQTNLGEGLATPAAKYFEDILSGDPTRIASALAPEISTGQGQVEQQRLRNAEFGTRSGGSTAATDAAERDALVIRMHRQQVRRHGERRVLHRPRQLRRSRELVGRYVVVVTDRSLVFPCHVMIAPQRVAFLTIGL